MPSFVLSNAGFRHPGSVDPLFSHLTLSLNSHWRTGLVGRNGRGKSTLLQLLHGSLTPDSGAIDRPLRTMLFPYTVKDEGRSVHSLIKEAVAPFDAWEQEMERLLAAGDDRSLLRYHSLFEQYSERGGFSIDAVIEREADGLGLSGALLRRPFGTLSGGERTRACIVPLFADSSVFPLLDEPTNHLDMDGRRLLGDYLAGKQGFIIASHDRALLDRCCDHVAAINKADIRVLQGNYSRWREQMALEQAAEEARVATIRREVAVLEQEAAQRRSWSMAAEREKIGGFDKGFLGRKAAKIMKRALAAERRIDERLEEQRSLLRNAETVRPLRLHQRDDAPELLVSLEEADVTFGGRTILQGCSLTVRRGERVAVIGPNGCGKSTLLHAVRGTLPLSGGRRRVPGPVTIVSGHQIPLWTSGLLRQHLRTAGIDETLFRTAMGSISVQGDIFDRPLETFSEGERKKVDLCRSFCLPHHLLVWDEPVNYIDIESKEAVERMIADLRPTLLFAEHDRAFIEAVATRVIHLPEGV
ncbi:MAG: ABC-F family ATP-binding cassette domain-containing protein [Bacteroidetes bacterium]|nr:ABC-F family ATP-binding cassette domain-containing protein [Bacteroidota bacterium]